MHNRVLLRFNYIRDRFRGRINGERSGQLIAEVTRQVDPLVTRYGAIPATWVSTNSVTTNLHSKLISCSRHWLPHAGQTCILENPIFCYRGIYIYLYSQINSN
jgi:hypothetical protein